MSPNIQVSERTVSPRFDRGLLAGLIAGGVSALWLTLIGGTKPFVLTAGLFLGAEYADTGFNAQWLTGLVAWLVLWSLAGIAFAALWPRLRRGGTWTPSIVFALAVYLLAYQVIGRMIDGGIVGELGFFGPLTAAFFAGVALAFRHRRD